MLEENETKRNGIKRNYRILRNAIIMISLTCACKLKGEGKETLNEEDTENVKNIIKLLYEK